MPQLDIVSQINAYESDDMDHETMIAFFQELVNSGLAWQLQGSYGRTAAQLISQNLVTRPSQESTK